MHFIRCLSCKALQQGANFKIMTEKAQKQLPSAYHCIRKWSSHNSWPKAQVPAPHSHMKYSSGVEFSNNGNQQDLKRFLQEIGTNPKEARFWLKQFQRTTEARRPFAIIQVDHSVFKDPSMLDSLCSCLSFLHRNDMRCVVIHGHMLANDTSISPEQLQNSRSQLVADSINLVRTLESHGTPTRIFFSGSNILQGQAVSDTSLKGKVTKVNLQPILELGLETDHIPILQSLGESSTGQLLTFDVCQVTAEVAKSIPPIKVLYLNAQGGITDSKGEVVANVHLPADLEKAVEKDWCTPLIQKRIEHIHNLLNQLPAQTSAVITSANSLLKELFTHNGSGTQFRITESINTYHSLDEIDCDRLMRLINISFGKELKSDYLESIKNKIKVIYLSKRYNAAAIITNEPGCDVAYMDKFAVSSQTQGEGTADFLWNKIREDYKHLFWRSRGTNWINPWYFKKSDGSWSDGMWTVFWYGVPETKKASLLVDHALFLPESFGKSDEVKTDLSMLIMNQGLHRKLAVAV